MWLKDGKPVPPLYSTSKKYTASVTTNGIVHKLVINDVQQSDQGVYTFKVAKQERVARILQIEGGSSTENTAALLRGFAIKAVTGGLGK